MPEQNKIISIEEHFWTANLRDRYKPATPELPLTIRPNNSTILANSVCGKWTRQRSIFRSSRTSSLEPKRWIFGERCEVCAGGKRYAL